MKKAKLELYNLLDDIGETHDLSSKNKVKAKELSDLLTKRLKDWDAQLPASQLTGKKVPYPNECD